nr:molecular chaperone [uncultured Cupriavidus sp.]
MKAKSVFCAALAVLGIAAGPSHAAIQVAGTRIVLEGDQKEQSVRLANTADTPVLAQIWLDKDGGNGTGTIEAGAQDVPFILTPPVARLNGGKSQVVRIFKSAEVASLPKDRESVFYFNALEIPARVGGKQGENHLNIALRTRLKMFYRPAGLKADLSEAAESLKWRVRRDGADLVVTCSNGSPLHVSFASLVLKQGKDKGESALPGGMAGPLADKEFRFVDAAAGTGAALSLDLNYITDLGAFVPLSIPLTAWD